MKSRAGFVSNSSSSSFIVNAESAFDIVKLMIPLREDGWEEANAELLELIEDMQERVDCESLRFRTCNYDTYIARVGDKFVVETCNNHRFWEIGSFEHLDEDYVYENEKELGWYDIEFYDIEGDFYFKKLSESEYSFKESYCQDELCNGENVRVTRGKYAGLIMCTRCMVKDKNK